MMRPFLREHPHVMGYDMGLVPKAHSDPVIQSSGDICYSGMAS